MAYTSPVFEQVYRIGMNALLETEIFVIYELFSFCLFFTRQLKKYNVFKFYLFYVYDYFASCMYVYHKCFKNESEGRFDEL